MRYVVTSAGAVTLAIMGIVPPAAALIALVAIAAPTSIEAVARLIGRPEK